MVHIPALSEMVFLNTAIQRLSYHVSKTVANIFLSFVFFPLGIESDFKTKKIKYKEYYTPVNIADV